MEGGIGIFLLLVVLVVVIGGGIALYVTGGAILTRGDKDASGGRRGRPRHKAPTTPAHEHTHFVGTPEARDSERDRR